MTVDRLEKWARPGLLCIGDAAHAMSPIGGVGINLAIQDAVATANILGPVLQKGVPSFRDLKKVQARREFPTRVIQAFQVAAQNFDAGAHPGGDEDAQAAAASCKPAECLALAAAVSRRASSAWACGPSMCGCRNAELLLRCGDEYPFLQWGNRHRL